MASAASILGAIESLARGSQSTSSYGYTQQQPPPPPPPPFEGSYGSDQYNPSGDQTDEGDGNQADNIAALGQLRGANMPLGPNGDGNQADNIAALGQMRGANQPLGPGGDGNEADNIHALGQRNGAGKTPPGGGPLGPGGDGNQADNRMGPDGHGPPPGAPGGPH
jgi:hypothetical protein